MVDVTKSSTGPTALDHRQECLLQSSRRPGLTVLRYSLLLFLTVGYLETYRFFASYSMEYFVLSVVSVGACGLLLTRLDAPLRITFPIWILVGIFCVGYYLQFYLFTGEDLTYPGQLVNIRNLSERLLLDAYSTITLAFSAFCLTAWLMRRTKRSGRRTALARPASAAIDARSARSLTGLLLVVIPILELFTGYVSWRTNIAVLGVESVTLPYRMAGVIFYARMVTLPALGLLLVYIAAEHGWKRRFQVGLGLLILHGAFDTIWRSSRSSLVFILLGLAFLTVLTGRMNARRLRSIAAGLALCLLLFPVLTVYRNLRAGGFGANVSDAIGALSEGIGSSYQAVPLNDVLSDTWLSVVFRITGTQSVLLVRDSGYGQLGFLHANEVTSIFNDEILQIPANRITAYAPSLVGWFYLLGGNATVVFGMAAFLLTIQLIWNALGSSNLRSKPIAQTLFLIFLVPVATDGVLEGSFWSAVVTVFTMGIVELLLRSPRRTPLAEREPGTPLCAQKA